MGTFLVGSGYIATPIQGIAYLGDRWPKKRITTVYQPTIAAIHPDQGKAWRICPCASCLTVWRVERDGYLKGKLGELAEARYVAKRESTKQPECPHLTWRREYHDGKCRWCYLGDPRYISDSELRRQLRRDYGLLGGATYSFLSYDWWAYHPESWAQYQRQYGLIAADDWQWQQLMLAGVYWSEEPAGMGPDLKAYLIMDVMRASTRKTGSTPGWDDKAARPAHGTVARTAARVGVPRQTAHDWWNEIDWQRFRQLRDDFLACDVRDRPSWEYSTTYEPEELGD